MKIFFTLLTLGLVGCSGNQQAEKESKGLPDSPNEANHQSLFDSVITREYFYTNLSHEFNIKVFFKSFLDSNQFADSSIVRLILLDKKGEKALDTIVLQPAFHYTNYFRDSMSVASYSTKFNTNREIVDNDFGQIIIADLNFDNQDDIALINDMGGNSGPLYSYFIQNTTGKFQVDRFLTDSMSFFPQYINRRAKTLIVRVLAGAVGAGEHVYYLDQGNKWKEKSHRVIRN